MAEKILNRKSGDLASRRRRSLCRSVISLADRPVDYVTSLCHDDRQSRFPLRSPPLPRGSNNVVSSRLCGEKSVTGTQPLVDNLYQVPMAIGMDSATGHYYARNRNYSPSLGSVSRQEPKSRLSAGAAHREINQDPAGYINGANTYQFVESNPVGNVDPWGLSAIYDEMMANASPPIPAGGAATITIYVVDRSGGVRTGSNPEGNACHIDMVIPGVGVVGYYGIGHGGAGNDYGIGDTGFWNDSYKDFERDPNGGYGRPMDVNPPGPGLNGGYLCTVASVQITPSQLKRMRGELKNLEGHPGTFDIVTNNCSENAVKVLNAGGLFPNEYPLGIDTPQHLIDQLQKQYGVNVYTGYTVENAGGGVRIIHAGSEPK
jgi:RHS repeat-associated protein